MNEFKVDLEYSLEASENKMFDNFYFRVFPLLKEIKIVKELDLQKQGIDKILIFKNGRKLLIDEKKRRSIYNDILLEEYSNFEKKIVGWLGRNKVTDYLVYAIMPTKKVFLLPFVLLQKAWLHNYHQWFKTYGRVFARNNTYKTSNIPIPSEILLISIKKEMSNGLDSISYENQSL